MKKILILSFTLTLLIFTGCTSKDPAILKVFVRSSTNQLVYGAKVIIIGDQQSNPATLPYVDTTFTNSSGFTTFDMNEYFDVSGPENTTGYFDILVKSNTKEAAGYTRCRIHTTSVETIYLPN
ncbi:MAG: hypothetical protein P8P80_05025 [Crocinitomicaceae bacterium]|jgi:hypothetical protein|nr:hypothetical protein [bacterium]MDG1350441.1 hypothetical protein [Crocinitomicaceae bacterium]MDG1735666.1 hypothetical protein [Crocinitomicaceae bacterium]MDG2504793.1 hypothetical protein [Crocinitomicaceae bacterium]